MNLRELLQRLEERVGSHQLPLNPEAGGLRDLFACVGLHHDWMRRLAHAIWRENRCTRLSDPVGRDETFHAFEALRLEVLRAPSTDLDLCRLLDEITEALNELFGTAARPRAVSGGARGSAQIVSLDAFRHRRFLRSSA